MRKRVCLNSTVEVGEGLVEHALAVVGEGSVGEEEGFSGGEEETVVEESQAGGVVLLGVGESGLLKESCQCLLAHSVLSVYYRLECQLDAMKIGAKWDRVIGVIGSGHRLIDVMARP